MDHYLLLLLLLLLLLFLLLGFDNLKFSDVISTVFSNALPTAEVQ
jgi:hypothetical protein